MIPRACVFMLEVRLNLRAELMKTVISSSHHPRHGKMHLAGKHLA